MKVLFLDGPSLVDRLPHLASGCTQLDIAMAYIKVGGLRTLVKGVESLLNKDIPLRVIFGFSFRQGITDKESAEMLLDLSKRKNVAVKKWNSSGFHPKLLIFYGSHPKVVVGSSNLTQAAQSTNAEANLLVEDADPELMQDSTRFFNHYFNPAPILRKKDVDEYPSRLPKGGARSSAKFNEDDLPSPLRNKHILEELKPRKIWKIAPGEDAKYWPEWVELIDEDGEGFIAIGWDDVGDLRNFKSYGSLLRKVEHIATTDWNLRYDKKTNVKYVADQLWTFKKAIIPNNVFIVYSETRVLGLAQATHESKYQYWKVRNLSFGHQANVKYWWFKDWPRRADDKIVKVLGRQGTLRPVEEDWLWNFLLKKLP